MKSANRAQSGEKRREQVVDIERRTEKMGDWQKGEKAMKSPKKTKRVNEGQRKGSERESQRYGNRDLECRMQK